MVSFDGWCGRKDQEVKGHRLTILTGVRTKLSFARDELAAVVPTHYAAKGRIVGIMRRLGKQAAAEYIREKLPTTKSLRSGDLGEILGSEYIEDATAYEVAVNRLRWKDHCEMAMRGDDIIAIKIDRRGSKPDFLKGEVKSRSVLSGRVIAEARKALRKHNNRPSPHALSYIADRLHEDGETELGDAIDDAQLKNGIARGQLTHLLFTFSGNNPEAMLTNDLEAYDGNVRQIAVGLHVDAHQRLIRDVYEKVIASGKLA
jgi:hypothetical protein